MLLTVDAGNTQTVFGLFAGDDLAHHWRIKTERERTADEYRVWLAGILGLEGLRFDSIEGAALSSVVPTVKAELRRMLGELLDGPTVVVEPGVRTGIAIQIDNPREVGADRLVNSLAAVERYGAPAVVVDFGTSTNFDVVGPDGAYIGGVIAAGVEVSHNALIGATAALRRVDLTPPRSVIGKGTVEAIQSGLLLGHAGLVDGIVERLREELGDSTPIIGTGGLANKIVPLTRTVEIVDEYLTLEGLRLVYTLNVN